MRQLDNNDTKNTMAVYFLLELPTVDVTKQENVLTKHLVLFLQLGAQLVGETTLRKEACDLLQTLMKM